MSRVIQTGDTAAKRRRAHSRSCAEALRRLAQRPSVGSGVFDDEARDLTAFIVFNLRGIGETIEESAQAWDDKNYWKKSEGLRADYRWAPRTADALEKRIVEDQWDEVPSLLVGLIPRFADVTIAQETRDADWWAGACRALKKKALEKGV